jgi:hypothetical protein
MMISYVLIIHMFISLTTSQPMLEPFTFYTDLCMLLTYVTTSHS